jgi:hypothetical protein
MTTDLTPGSPAWCRTVTASKVAAILGHSPFMSQRAVYHLMRGEYEVPVTDAMMRGQYLEDGVLRWWHDQHPEYQAWSDQPSYLLGDWAAATPDQHASGQDDKQDVFETLVEAKTSANDDEWGRPGTDEIPTHYLTQCYWAMHVSGIHETRVPVLTSRLRFEEYIVKHDPEVGALLEERCRAFYDSLSSDTPPPLDDSVSTFECMKRLHPDIEPGLTVEIPMTLAVHFVMNAAHLDILEQKQRLIRSELFDLAGKAQHLECNGVRVARRQSMGSGVSLVRVAKSTDQLIQEPAA